MEKMGVANRAGTTLMNEKKYFNPSMPLTLLQTQVWRYNCAQFTLAQVLCALE